MTQNPIDGVAANQKAKVFLVDDDPSVLRALGRLLRTSGFDVESFDRPRAFLERPRYEGPSCAVLDLRMPELDGLVLLEKLSGAGGAPPVIFLTGHGDVPTATRAMKDGAVDFLCKPVRAEELLDAIERALARDAEGRARRAEQGAARARFDGLTPREREVCLLAAQGLGNKQIADELGTSEQTVKVQRMHAMKKLGIDSILELARLVDRLR